MIPDSSTPYLSVVVTTRNDNHGGNPLGRFQAFVNCLVAQCRRVQLPAELIVVDWNPPADRPPLRDALAWPVDLSPCVVRIIQVPAELHQTLKHADALPLFQMIGKNVGIRRARGRFILSTNIDILLSNDLVDYIAAGKLQPGVMYRIDRRDVDAAVPIDASLDEIMAYCRSHQLRKHASWGTMPVQSNGEPALSTPDIVDAGAGIRCGEGWHVREGTPGLYYRWASERAELLLDDSIESGLLNVEFQSDPFTKESSVSVRLADDAGRTLQEPMCVTGSQIVQFAIPPGVSRRLWIEATAGDGRARELPPFEYRDHLVYRVLRMWWDTVERSGSAPRIEHPYPLDAWTPSAASEAVIAPRLDALDIVTDPRAASYAVEYRQLTAPVAGTYRFWLTATMVEGNVSVGALKGDRSAWLAEALHIRASGGRHIWSLTLSLEAGESFWIVMWNHHPHAGTPSRFVLRGITADRPYDELAHSAETVAALSAPDPGAHASIGTRVRLGLRDAAGRVLRRSSFLAGEALRRRFPVLDRDRVKYTPVVDQRLIEQVRTLTLRYEELRAKDDALQARYAALVPLAQLEPVRSVLAAARPDNVHANACGDFQLMARENWIALRGFAEFQMYSMNIDGLFGIVAHYAGIREHVFKGESCAYHIEHDVGSGWTPEGEAALRRRIQERGIRWLDSNDVMLLSSYMKWLGHPMIFNDPDWGFGEATLPEVTLK